MKQLFLDVETTGLDEKQHKIRDLSFVIYIDGEKRDFFDEKIFVPGTQNWSPWVIENMATPEDYIEEQSAGEAYGKLISTLKRYVNPFDKKDKFHFYAYNSGFDERFMRAFFEQHNDRFFGSYFWKPVIDVMSLAGEHFKEVRHELKDFKLETVAEALNINIETEKLHESLYDIELTKKVYDAIKTEK